MKQPITRLPKSAHIDVDYTGAMEIKNHKPDVFFMGWMMDLVRFHEYEETFENMEKQGIPWIAASEHLVAEIKSCILEWVLDKFVHDDTDECYEFSITVAGENTRDYIIDTIQKCESYWDFAEKFCYEGEFALDIRKRMGKVVE